MDRSAACRDGLRIGQRWRHGLLQQHVFAGLDRRHRLRAVKMIGTADDHCVDLAGQRLGEIGGSRRSGNGLRGFLRGFGHGVDAVHDAHPVEIAVDAQVVGGHAAASDERNVNHACFCPARVA